MRWLTLAVALVLLAAAPAAAAPGLQEVGAGFSSPVAVAGPPGDPSRLMVVEQNGTIALVKDGQTAAQPFLDVRSITLSGGERGLLSVAFPPDYQTTGLFYVYLTAQSPNGEIQVIEYRRLDADHADPATKRIVLHIPHTLDNHNGGQLQFGPDGLLWIGVGDGGGANDTEGNAQVTSRLKGKLLRIDPHASGGQQYTVPGDNPFGNAVWAYGLRNPWRFTFDRLTGDLAIGDVGQDHHEEVDYATRAGGLGRGANYGWPCREGRFANVGCTAPGAVEPLIDQTHDDGWCAIIGGPVVRDPALPSLAGRLLYGDDCQPQIHGVDPAAGQASDRACGISVDQLTAFGEDAAGHVYVASLRGPVWRITDGASPCTPVAQAGPATTAADTTPCTLSVRASGTRRVARHRYVQFGIRASEACRVTVAGSVRGVGRFRTAHKALPAGKRVGVRLWLTPRTRRALGRALNRRHSVTLRLRVQGVDAAGNASTVRKPVRLRP